MKLKVGGACKLFLHHESHLVYKKLHIHYFQCFLHLDLQDPWLLFRKPFQVPMSVSLLVYTFLLHIYDLQDLWLLFRRPFQVPMSVSLLDERTNIFSNIILSSDGRTYRSTYFHLLDAHTDIFSNSMLSSSVICWTHVQLSLVTACFHLLSSAGRTQGRVKI